MILTRGTSAAGGQFTESADAARRIRPESVHLLGVSRSFDALTGPHHVLHDVDLLIGAGEISR